MPKLSIVISRQAQRFMDSLNPKTRSRIVSELLDLENFPRLDHHDVAKLKGRGERYRLRVGDIRVIFKITEETSTVYIDKIEYRGRVYKG